MGEKPRMELCGTALQWVNMVKHIGNYLDANMKEETEIQRKKGDLIQRVNNILVSIGKSSDAVVRKANYTQYAHLYGAAALNFRDKAVSEFRQRGISVYGGFSIYCGICRRRQLPISIQDEMERSIVRST